MTNAAAAYEAQLAGNTWIFNISDGGDVVIDGLTLTGGRVGE
ncbi:MAG: hypothetical protein P8Q48_10285 [Paracoccaceae bacterium]|nr:hypothetical protein [Paracoccaceae bacterium]MDG1370605.1 hypothetical protein [Paracoccaceae bacterium]